MNHKDIKFIKQDNYRENKRDFMEALFKMLDIVILPIILKFHI